MEIIRTEEKPSIIPATKSDALPPFNEDYFRDLFERFPLLWRFTEDMQTSTDEVFLTTSLSAWQQALYAFLSKKLGSKVTTRFEELERTLLSIISSQVFPQSDDAAAQAFIKAAGSDLTSKEMKEIGGLLGSKPDETKIIFKIISGDLTKINTLREHFGLWGDHDVVLDQLFKEDPIPLATFLEVPVETIKDWQASHFPFHLGHGVQAENTEGAFINVAAWLTTLSETQRESAINRAIAYQAFDVAGARAPSGKILLNRIIWANYAKLQETLLKLARGENPSSVYCEYTTGFFRETKIQFKNKSLQARVENKESGGFQDFEGGDAILRIMVQMRIPQITDPLLRQAKATEAEEALLKAQENNQEFKQALAQQTEYYRSGASTFTYGPAIFSTLQRQWETLTAEQKPIGITNATEYAAVYGTIIQGKACKVYLEVAESVPDLLQTPLSFNDLNGLLNRDPRLALRIVDNTEPLGISSEGAVILRSSLDLTTSTTLAPTSASTEPATTSTTPIFSTAESKGSSTSKHKKLQQSIADHYAKEGKPTTVKRPAPLLIAPPEEEKSVISSEAKSRSPSRSPTVSMFGKGAFSQEATISPKNSASPALTPQPLKEKTEDVSKEKELTGGTSHLGIG